MIKLENKIRGGQGEVLDLICEELKHDRIE